jgi:hypothetical protein
MLDSKDRPRDYIGLPLDDDHYFAIGHVAAMWNAVESQTLWLIWRMMNVTPGQGAPITAAVRHETLVNAIPLLAKQLHLHAQTHDEIRAVTAELIRLRERRNKIVHAIWNFGSGPRMAEVHSWKIKGKKEQFDPEAINKIALEINKLLRRVLNLTNEIYDTLHGRIRPPA